MTRSTKPQISSECTVNRAKAVLILIEVYDHIAIL